MTLESLEQRENVIMVWSHFVEKKVRRKVSWFNSQLFRENIRVLNVIKTEAPLIRSFLFYNNALLVAKEKFDKNKVSMTDFCVFYEKLQELKKQWNNVYKISNKPIGELFNILRSSKAVFLTQIYIFAYVIQTLKFRMTHRVWQDFLIFTG